MKFQRWCRSIMNGEVKQLVEEEDWEEDTDDEEDEDEEW
jgi:hypothetical protein